MRVVLFILYLFAFFTGGQHAVAADRQDRMRCVQMHFEQSKFQQDGSDLGFTFVEDNLDTPEDNFSDKTKNKDSVKFLIAKSHFPEHFLSSTLFTVTNYRCKSVKTFAYFSNCTEPIYIIHRVLRI